MARHGKKTESLHKMPITWLRSIRCFSWVVEWHLHAVHVLFLNSLWQNCSHNFAASSRHVFAKNFSLDYMWPVNVIFFLAGRSHFNLATEFKPSKQNTSDRHNWTVVVPWQLRRDDKLSMSMFSMRMMVYLTGELCFMFRFLDSSGVLGHSAHLATKKSCSETRRRVWRHPLILLWQRLGPSFKSNGLPSHWKMFWRLQDLWAIANRTNMPYLPLALWLIPLLNRRKFETSTPGFASDFFCIFFSLGGPKMVGEKNMLELWGPPGWSDFVLKAEPVDPLTRLFRHCVSGCGNAMWRSFMVKTKAKRVNSSLDFTNILMLIHFVFFWTCVKPECPGVVPTRQVTLRVGGPPSRRRAPPCWRAPLQPSQPGRCKKGCQLGYNWWKHGYFMLFSWYW